MHKNDIRNMSKPKALLLMAFVFIIGAVLLGFGVYNLIIAPSKYSKYIEIEGTVVDHKSSTSDRDMYALVVQYTVDGQDYTITGNEYTNFPASLGSTQKVKYNPDNPKEAILPTQTNVANLVFTGLGGLFVILAIVGTVMRLRYKGDQVVEDSTSGIDNYQQF